MKNEASFQSPSLPIRTLVSRLRSGEIDLMPFIEECVDRAKASNSSLNAFVEIDLESAKKQAQELLRSKTVGPLFGVPFSAKDHLAVQGLPRGEGTALGRKAKASGSCKAVELLLAQGAICIGKTNQAEYGRSYFTDNSAFGRTHNAHKQNLSPGGSGGGDATAVASGAVTFGLGSDMSGSVRVPACFQGLFGMFPTPGSVSAEGPYSYHHSVKALLSSIGPIARSTDDLRILLSSLFHFDRLDPCSTPRPYGWQEIPSRHGRVISVRELNGIRPDPEIEKALIEVEGRLQQLGFEIDHSTVPALERCQEQYVLLAGQASLMADDLFAGRNGLPRDPQNEGEELKDLRRRISSELPPLTAQTLLHSLISVVEIRRSIFEMFESSDFLLAPVAACLPPAYDDTRYRVGNKTLPTEEVFHYSTLANLCGIPAITFPVQRSSTGLPVGLQIHANRYCEGALLNIVQALEFRQALLPEQ